MNLLKLSSAADFGGKEVVLVNSLDTKSRSRNSITAVGGYLCIALPCWLLSTNDFIVPGGKRILSTK